MYKDSILKIVKSNLTSNKAMQDGGAVRGQHGQLSIIKSVVTYNRALRHGGGIYIGTRYGGAPSMGADQAGVIFRTPHHAGVADLLLVDSSVSYNKAHGIGGGLMLEAGASANITTTNVTNCVASQGGGIYAEISDIAEDASITTLYESIITIDADVQNNSASNLLVGPFWHLVFTNPALLNESSKGVSWQRKI